MILKTALQQITQILLMIHGIMLPIVLSWMIELLSHIVEMSNNLHVWDMGR